MSETKTAKVTGVLQVKPFDGKYGRMYFHKIELDNGDIGEIGKKTENGIKIGDSLTYTSEDGQYGLKFKAVTENGFGGGNGFKGGGSRGSTASFSLSYAKDIVVAAMPFHQDKSVNDWVEATKMIAGKLNTWLKENE